MLFACCSLQHSASRFVLIVACRFADACAYYLEMLGAVGVGVDQANMSRPPEAQVHVRRVGSEYARGTALVYSPEEWSKAHVHSQQPQGPCRPHRHPPPPLVRESVAVVGAAHSGSEHAPAAGRRHVQAWFQHQAECESEEGELGDSAGFHDAQAEFSGSQSSGQNSRRASAIDAEQSDHDDDDNAGHSRLRRSFCCSRDSLGEDECTEAREGSWSGSHSESDSCCSESSDDGASSECAPPLSGAFVCMFFVFCWWEAFSLIEKIALHGFSVCDA